MSEPAYTRLPLDERRRQLIDAGSTLFAAHAFEEISMAEIAKAAGVSKALLYHYFPSKSALFEAATAEYSAELARLIEPDGQGSPLEQLARSLDGYLGWIENNAGTWAKLVQTAASLPEAREFADGFRNSTLDKILTHLTAGQTPSPVLRNALQGWIGYTDAAILDWIHHEDLTRQQLTELILAAFGNTLLAAQQTDPAIELDIS